MKIVVADALPSAGCPEVAWHFMPDSTLTNAGKPFFIPDFADCFEVSLSMALRISRIGKSVGERFVSRYYSEVAPALLFRASGLSEKLHARGLPADMAYSFDRSLIAGGFIPVEDFIARQRVELHNNGECVATLVADEYTEAAESVVAMVSRTNTIKMGDIFLPMSTPYVPIIIGDRLEVCSDNTPLLMVAVK